jgi:hypothetical protein
MDELGKRLLAFLQEGESNMVLGPIRKVRENPYSVTARLSSSKLGRIVQAESLLEYDFLNILDFDPRVKKYGEQSLEIPWKDENKRPRKYHPDVLVKFDRKLLNHLRCEGYETSTRFCPTVYEVKPLDILKADWAEFKPKYKAAQSALSEFGVRFRIITERQINPIFAQNVRFLLGYKLTPDASGKYRNEVGIDNELDELIRTLDATITPKQILDKFSQSFEVRSRIVARIWRMIAHGMFDADLVEPLTMLTPLWPGQMYRGSDNIPTPKWRQPQYDWYR